MPQSVPNLDGGVLRRIGNRVPWLRPWKRLLFGYTVRFLLSSRALTDDDIREAPATDFGDLTFRTGTQADVPDLCATWPPEFEPMPVQRLAEVFRQRLRSSVPCVVACRHGHVVGATWIMPRQGLLAEIDLPDGDSMCELRNTHLAPEVRGRGGGTMLRRHAIHAAARLGFKRVYILNECRTDRAAAVASAIKAGFEVLGTLCVRKRLGRTTIYVEPSHGAKL